MIIAWINNSIELEIAQSIMWMDSTTEMWSELNDCFYQVDDRASEILKKRIRKLLSERQREKGVKCYNSEK